MRQILISRVIDECELKVCGCPQRAIIEAIIKTVEGQVIEYFCRECVPGWASRMGVSTGWNDNFERWWGQFGITMSVDYETAQKIYRAGWYRETST